MLNTEAIRISVALITRNGSDRLERCLRSLRSQNVQPFEIIVSDDSTGTFAAATRVVAEGHGCRYLEGPRRGLYANRNFAALACRGTHIRTMDDDHTFPAGHFAQCLGAVQQEPGAIWTTGEIGYVDETFVNRGETANQLHPSGVGIAPADLDDNWSISDGSTIYPAIIFEKGYRMVEDYGYGSSYLEFGAFLYKQGYRSRCLRGAVVEHHATNEIICRRSVYNRSMAASLLFASLAYNLYFRPSLFNAWSYAFKILLRSRFDPSLVAEIPKIKGAIYRRWGGSAAA